MQRRAAAMYVALFVIIAVGSIGFITAAEPPSEELDEFDYQLEPDDTFVLGDTEYTLTGIDSFSATVVWSEPDQPQASTITNESRIESDGTEFRVEIPSGEDPSSVTLVETYPDHDLETTEIDGVTYVIVGEEDPQLVSEDQYLLDEFGPRERRELRVDESFVWDQAGTSVTVDAISETGVDVSWVGPMNLTRTIPRGEPVQLGGTTVAANFIGTEYIQLTTDIEAFQEHQDKLQTWDERFLGFWGIGVLSLIAAILIGGLSYLPRRR